MCLLIYFHNDKKNIKKAVMSEDKLDDIQGRGRVGAGLLQGSSLFQPTRGWERGQGGAILKICVRMLPSNSTPPTNQSRAGPGFGVRGGNMEWQG